MEECRCVAPRITAVCSPSVCIWVQTSSEFVPGEGEALGEDGGDFEPTGGEGLLPEEEEEELEALRGRAGGSGSGSGLVVVEESAGGWMSPPAGGMKCVSSVDEG